MVGRASGLECGRLLSICSMASFRLVFSQIFDNEILIGFDSLPSSTSLLHILISALLHDLMDGRSPCMSFRLYVSLVLAFNYLLSPL